MVVIFCTCQVAMLVLAAFYYVMWFKNENQQTRENLVKPHLLYMVVAILNCCTGIIWDYNAYLSWGGSTGAVGYGFSWILTNALVTAFNLACYYYWLTVTKRYNENF